MTVNINQFKIIFFMTFISAMIFLYFFDLSFKVGNEFSTVGILLFYLICIFALSIKKFNNIINPMTLLLPFLFAIIYYQLYCH